MYPPVNGSLLPDINKDPFIVNGREAFNNSVLLAVSKVLQHPKHGRIGYDQFSLSIPSDKLLLGHIEVVSMAFSKFRFCKKPEKYVEHGKAAPGQEYIFITFADNIHKVSEDEEEFEAWDDKRIEDAKHRFVNLLDATLIDYYNDAESNLGF